MPKLCQINALVSGRKSETEKFVGDLYKIVQKPELFSGFERVYRPHDEEHGEKLPPERQKVQHRVEEIMDRARVKWTELWDLIATQDTGNQTAKANVVVDGITVLSDVPITTLLALDKQVNDLETFLSKLPTPDISETWTNDPNTGLLRSEPSQSVRSKKEPTHYEKAPATREHPAQVEFFYKDVPVGTWQRTAFSAAISYEEKQGMLLRVKKLQDALKIAREEANSIEVERRRIGDPIFGFVFGG